MADHNIEELPDDIAQAAEQRADQGVNTIADFLPKNARTTLPPTDPQAEPFAPDTYRPAPQKRSRTSHRGGKGYPEPTDRDIELMQSDPDVLTDPAAEELYRQIGRSGLGHEWAMIEGAVAARNATAKEVAELPRNHQDAIKLARLQRQAARRRVS